MSAGQVQPHGQPRLGPARHLRNQRRHARAAGRARKTTRARPKRWRCSATRPERPSARWPARWKASTRWCLRAASANTRRKCARASATASASSASSSIPRATPQDAAGDLVADASAVSGARDPHRRAAHDRPPCAPGAGRAAGPAHERRPRCCARCTPTGRRPTTCRSARSTCRTIRCWREPLRTAPRQGAPARPLGHHARPQFHLRPPEPRDQGARPVGAVRRRPRPRRPGAGGQRLPRRHLQRNLSAHQPGRSKACSACSSSSPSPAAFPATSRRKRPGSIHEGGELGYSLSHAFGAAFDNPDLLVACVVGDGEAETGPLATSWHSNKFLNPVTRRRRAADPAPERLQDRRPDRAGAHSPPRTGRAVPRLRLRAVLRRGRRSGRHAPADGGHARRRRRAHPRASSTTRASTASPPVPAGR